jgi:hypothetical protein
MQKEKKQQIWLWQQLWQRVQQLMQQQLLQVERLGEVRVEEEVLVGVVLQVPIHQVREEEEDGKNTKKHS